MTVHLLDVASIPGHHIMSVTGHKSESSLKSYTGHTTTKTKKKMSNIVTDSLRTMNVKSETNTQMEANSEILTNNVNVTNEATFNINIPYVSVKTDCLQSDLVVSVSTKDRVLSSLKYMMTAYSLFWWSAIVFCLH
jgi:DNA phosphorothioation-dependent restriction protein DptG